MDRLVQMLDLQRLDLRLHVRVANIQMSMVQQVHHPLANWREFYLPLGDSLRSDPDRGSSCCGLFDGRGGKVDRLHSGLQEHRGRLAACDAHRRVGRVARVPDVQTHSLKSLVDGLVAGSSGGANTRQTEVRTETREGIR